MAAPPFDRAWLDMKDLLRPRFAQALWIPLFLRQQQSSGTFGSAGYVDDYYGVRTLAVHEDQRDAAKQLEFSSLSHDSSASVWNGKYQAAGVYQTGDGVEIGIQLALLQTFPGDEQSVLHLHQDFALALGLCREGNDWVRPREGYARVARLELEPDGQATGLFVRPEFLRDYLAARKMALLIRLFRDRRISVADPSTLGLVSGETIKTKVEDGDAEIWIHDVGAREKVAVFKLARTEAWGTDELPVLGQPTDENTTSERSTRLMQRGTGFLALSQFHRAEWIEPLAASPRVGRDRTSSNVTFITDAAGTRTPANELNFEDVGRWLWFSPQVINDLLGRRGTSLTWYTRYTAAVQTSSGESVHFGLNDRDLVVVYAEDVAGLDEWEQRVWAGYNVAPDGGIGDELHASQVAAEPAGTEAPEAWLARARAQLDQAFMRRWGAQLFAPHKDIDAVLARCHRFRARDEAGFLGLAKDLARVTFDDFNIGALHAIAPPLGKEGRGSIRSLERVLTTVVPAEQARALLGVLAGVNELRHGDAHLPPSSIEDATRLAGVHRPQSWLAMGGEIIHNVVGTLFRLAEPIAPSDSARS
jgi:hypothetical protein